MGAAQRLAQPRRGEPRGVAALLRSRRAGQGLSRVVRPVAARGERDPARRRVERHHGQRRHQRDVRRGRQAARGRGAVRDADVDRRAGRVGEPARSRVLGDPPDDRAALPVAQVDGRLRRRRVARRRVRRVRVRRALLRPPAGRRGGPPPRVAATSPPRRRRITARGGEGCGVWCVLPFQFARHPIFFGSGAIGRPVVVPFVRIARGRRSDGATGVPSRVRWSSVMCGASLLLFGRAAREATAHEKKSLSSPVALAFARVAAGVEVCRTPPRV